MARLFTYLQYLPAFEAVARLGTVRAAAGELNLSPGAISLQLKKLSEATNTSLFERAGRNVILTQAGREFSQAAALVLSQLDSALYASKNMARLDQPASLSVSLPAALGIAWLSGALVEFAENCNISNLTINEASGAAQVNWDVNDIAIVYDTPPFPGKFSQHLADVRLRAVCSPILFPRLDLRHRDRKLNGATLLQEDEGEEWAKWAVAARVNLRGCARVRVGSVAQAVASAVQGHGVALVSDVLTRNYVGEGRLIQPFGSEINAIGEYHVLCPPDRADEPMIKAFVETMLNYFRLPQEQRG